MYMNTGNIKESDADWNDEEETMDIYYEITIAFCLWNTPLSIIHYILVLFV